MDRLLNIFITVVEEKNLTRAGDKCFITQSAISQNLKLLEKKYNAQLLNRTNKQISLTKAGEILYVHARQIINQYTLAERLIYELQEGISGPLNIGSGFTFGEYLLPDLISKFITKHPKIRPKITIKNSIRIANQVKENNLDIGIIEREVTDDLIQATPFAEDDMVIIVPTNFINNDKDNISYLSDKTWIIRENGSGTRQVTDNMFNNTGINPTNILEFGSTQIIKEAVRKGLGVSYISKVAVQNELKKGMIKSLSLDNYKDTRKFYYVINKSQPSTKILEMFINTINFKS
ncbi:LysR family transcriptional regulator [Bacillus sp. RAR_GA_16]|uniref:LysR family transcriptional regulator n=1 Tax=Bacillus sp. RAR_GA_16 TaxID=2876774 RepID=UPI001CCB5462|nr:LysR family transcriptional regulator [Bacillus sp. RAR_GA_16]MCA0174559.1 LysR family transcriptional regulator [Bacillus sp. RAR_GA_16]